MLLGIHGIVYWLKVRNLLENTNFQCPYLRYLDYKLFLWRSKAFLWSSDGTVMPCHADSGICVDSWLRQEVSSLTVSRAHISLIPVVLLELGVPNK
jgi:hypothetical protein